MASRRSPRWRPPDATGVGSEIGPGISSLAGGISIPRTFIRRLSVR